MRGWVGNSSMPKREMNLSFMVSRTMSENTVQLRTFYGTPLYASPELCENLPYTAKTDVWSLGMVLVEAALGRYPVTELAAATHGTTPIHTT